MNAALIICHKNPTQVLRLAKRLKTSNCDVYIHADSNMMIEDYNYIKEHIALIGGIYLTKNRLHGELDKRSLVDITMELISDAINNHSYKYYLLFSGQDYPIKPIAWIEEQLNKSYPKPFIDCTPYAKDNWVYHKFAQNGLLLKYNSWISQNFKKGVLRSCLRVSALIIRKLCQIARMTTKQKMDKLTVGLFGGSAWWILPDSIVTFIKEEYDSNCQYIRTLLNSVYTPEETFFQILAMRSPLKDLITLNPTTMVEQNCKTWAYFSDINKPFKGHPYVFTMEEIDKIKQSKFWFARKFDTNIDEKILDEIDKHILCDEMTF